MLGDDLFDSQSLFVLIACAIALLVLIGELLHRWLSPQKALRPPSVKNASHFIQPHFLVSLLERSLFVSILWTLSILLSVLTLLIPNQFSLLTQTKQWLTGCFLFALWWIWRKDCLK